MGKTLAKTMYIVIHCHRFAMHRWLAVDEDDGKIELELEPTEVTKKDIGKCHMPPVDFLKIFTWLTP